MEFQNSGLTELNVSLYSLILCLFLLPDVGIGHNIELIESFQRNYILFLAVDKIKKHLLGLT